MKVWICEYDEYPGDYDSSYETIRVFTSMDKAKEAYPAVEWVDVHQEYEAHPEGTAFMGFNPEVTIKRDYNANYWVSEWELE